MAFYIAPAEAKLLMEAGRTLRNISRRCRDAAYPVTGTILYDELPYAEKARKLREFSEQIRSNLIVSREAETADEAVFNLFNAAQAFGDCDVSIRVVNGWRGNPEEVLTALIGAQE